MTKIPAFAPSNNWVSEFKEKKQMVLSKVEYPKNHIDKEGNLHFHYNENFSKEKNAEILATLERKAGLNISAPERHR